MKDYLIKFDEDGRRGTTYAEGVHYCVNDDGTVEDGSINVKELLKEGYIFVETEDYAKLLGNGEEHKEYCRKPDGTFAPYIPPEPSATEKKANAVSQIKSKYQPQLDSLADARVKAAMLGADVSKIDSQYKTTLANMAAEIKNA